MRRNSDPRVNEGSLWLLLLILSMLEDMDHTMWFIFLEYCWAQSPLIFKEGKKKSGQWYFEGLWIWHLKTWFSDQLGSAGLVVGFNDPRGLFQPKQPCDSLICYNQSFFIGLISSCLERGNGASILQASQPKILRENGKNLKMSYLSNISWISKIILDCSQTIVLIFDYHGSAITEMQKNLKLFFVCFPAESLDIEISLSFFALFLILLILESKQYISCLPIKHF